MYWLHKMILSTPMEFMETPPKNESANIMQKLLEKSYNNRFWITVFTLLIFMLLISGIGYALFTEANMPQEWKEILLLVLGVFTGSYNRVIDFWFNNTERDKEMMYRADIEDGISTEDIRSHRMQSVCRCDCEDCLRGDEHNHHGVSHPSRSGSGPRDDDHTLEP